MFDKARNNMTDEKSFYESVPIVQLHLLINIVMKYKHFANV